MNISLSAPDIGEKEIDYVIRVLQSGQLSIGPWLARFEERFAEYAGTKYAVAASSGTSALHMCVRALGLGAGDEVLTTSFSFVASVNCLLYEGVRPAFVDIDPLTFNVDPGGLREFMSLRCARTADGSLIDKLTGKKVKGLLPVHIFGLPCDMDAIMSIADEYGLLVIEDACEAIGAEIHSRRVGTFGNAAVFAFYPNKQMTTGEGGMVVTNDARVAEICQSLRNQGRDADGRWLRHVRLGYNYRLSDIHAALGLAQLERIDQLLSARAEVAGIYSQFLAGHPGLRLPTGQAGMKRSWFVYVVRFLGHLPREARDAVQARLREKGLPSQIYFPAIHRQPFFEHCVPDFTDRLPHTEHASDTCLALPFSSRMRESEIRLVCDEVLRALDSVDVTKSSLSVLQVASGTGAPLS